jgi:hypothetical protein
MLTPNETHRLTELERRLAQDDPAWTRRMTGCTAVRPVPFLPLAGGAVYVMAPFVGLLAGWPGLVALLLTFAAVAAVSVAVRRR